MNIFNDILEARKIVKLCLSLINKKTDYDLIKAYLKSILEAELLESSNVTRNKIHRAINRIDDIKYISQLNNHKVELELKRIIKEL